MADNKIHLPYPERGRTVYFQVWTLAGLVWTGTAWEAYNAAHWANYAVTMAEQGASGIYLGTFPAVDAGRYQVHAFVQEGAAPAETDALAGSGEAIWDGTDIGSSSDADAVAVAVWTSGDRTLTDHGVVEDRLTAVRAGYFDSIPGIAAVTTQLSGMLETDGAVSRFTANALEEGPVGGDATAANQTTIIGLINALQDLSAAEAAAAILATPANKLVTNSSGQVAASNMRGTDGAYTGTPPTTAAITTAVWAAASRTLTSLEPLTTRLSELRGGYLDDLPTLAATIAKLASMLETDGAVSRFTANALEEGPVGGDATSANQTTILAAVNALPSAAGIAAAVLAAVVDGTMDVGDALKAILAFSSGKVVRSSADPITLDFYNAAGTTVVFSLTVAADGSGRENV